MPRRARVRKLTPLCHTLADLEGGARSALEGAASCDMIFLSAAALVLICLAAAAFFAAFFAAILARYLSAILSATFNAHLAACLLLFRKVFGTSKVPNLLCWAKTPWSLRDGVGAGPSARQPRAQGPRCLRTTQQVRHLRGPEDLPEQQQGGGQVRVEGGRQDGRQVPGQDGGEEGGEEGRRCQADEHQGDRRQEDHVAARSSLQGGACASLQVGQGVAKRCELPHPGPPRRRRRFRRHPHPALGARIADPRPVRWCPRCRVLAAVATDDHGGYPSRAADAAADAAAAALAALGCDFGNHCDCRRRRL